MDTVIRNINLYGKPQELGIQELQEWVNDTANKLNIMLNNGAQAGSTNNITNIYNSNTYEPSTPSEPEQPSEPQIKPSDYVIETGETIDGICEGTIQKYSKCYWRKWHSGIMEIWGHRMSNNIVFTQSPWGGYESKVDTGAELLDKIGVWGTWPVPFVEIPSVEYRVATTMDAALSGDYEIIHSQTDSTTGQLTDLLTKSPEFKVWRGSEKTFYNPTITFHAIGSWK